MENKHGKSHAGSAFLIGFILGAVFASLLLTKKGRAVLRELVNTGMELIEDFIEERKNKEYEKATAQREKVIEETENESVAQAAEDLSSEVEPVEAAAEELNQVEVDAASAQSFDEPREVSEEALKFAKHMDENEKPAKRGSKRRLFKGIRKSKPN